MPQPLPRFGLVQAQPHEFLIRLRKGQVVTAVQGGSCFRWPGDTVALVDTSVHRLQFTADQITRERTGVQVTGLAVFRVVQPLIAWRMLDLSDLRAVEGILKEMFVGATRRLVANLSLDECLTRRKEALATELMSEVAPVVSGSGRPEDDSDQGWGIALDTIEVQDVRVLSQEVFSRLQAPYREELELSAMQAQAQVVTERARLAEETARTQERRRRELMALEEARLEAERERARQAREHEEALRRAALDARLQREDAEARAQDAREEARAEAALRRAERAAESAVAQAELKARAERLEREVAIEMLRLEREARAQVSEGQLRELALTHTLPEVARAYRGSFDKVVVTGASDLSFVGQGLTQALASLEAFGLRWPGGAQAE
ncbi:MAG: SPFH domain-containing protein [Alphaproteobacteria bacterium]|nr:SPFH domain-containing protein [Alphaproteobacteria bacterium]MCB9796107.1 SPFH domain-containing protein [Alphaproteobacteria bacterium]